MKKLAIKKQRDNFLTKYEDFGISSIPFIMEIEADTLYSMDMFKVKYPVK
jgi:hypothetical protein